MNHASAAEAMNARVGEVLAEKYQLQRVLGVGGMGAVFEAKNTWTDRRVAIKVMLATRDANPEVVARFLREAKAAARIAHPNIVDVLDVGRDDASATTFIVQEFLDGEDLSHVLLRESRLAPRRAFDALAPVMSALISAHEQSIVHRDLKPENIFLSRTAHGLVPKLIDFGIAKMSTADDKGMALTRTGAAMGTPYYMSPEQARGEKSIDAQTDVWAIGVVWFEALAGRCPFEGESYNQLLSQILTEEAPPLRSVAPDVPPRLAATIDRALVRGRAQRFSTMRDFLSALIACDGLDGVHWNPATRAQLGAAMAPTAFESAPTGVVNTQPDAPSAPLPAVPARTMNDFSTTLGQATLEIAPRRPTNSRTALWIGAAVAAIAIVTASGIYLRVRGSTPNAPQPAPTTQVTAATTATSTPAPAPASVPIAMIVDPSSAAIELDGAPAGTGSLVREVSADRSHRIVVRAEGFTPATFEFTNSAPPASVHLQAMPHVAAPSTQAGTTQTRTRTTTRRTHNTPPPSATQGTSVNVNAGTDRRILHVRHDYP